MHRRGLVQVTNNDLAARCTVCTKHIAYAKMDPPMTLLWWDSILRAFVRKHNKECSLPEELK